ncbi:FkbM family methyltransferase [Effusibacillus consociatus]|uniref:FkbM family methyltransferase n=1 Tax=Effusibacillus consociatus TaxID=1117041 RepID=A0ABV9Q0J3_9BACL
MFPFVETDVLLNDVKMTMLTHSQDGVIGVILRNSQNVRDGILDYLQNTIKPGSHVLDAGANIGSTAIFLAKVQPTATIYCFEPDPLNYALLNINISLNNVENIYTFNCALGREHKFVDFFMNFHNFGDHRSTKPKNTGSDAGSFKRLPYRIPMVNPVDFLKQCLGDHAPLYFDLLKIDTQGADFDILDACLPLIRDDSIIVAEYSPYHLYLNGTQKEDIANIVTSFSNKEIINPTHNPHRTANINLQQLLLFYEENYRELRTHCDIVLKNYTKKRAAMIILTKYNRNMVQVNRKNLIDFRFFCLFLLYTLG